MKTVHSVPNSSPKQDHAPPHDKSVEGRVMAQKVSDFGFQSCAQGSHGGCVSKVLRNVLLT